MNDELQTLLQMAMQTTAPVSTDVLMYDEEEQFIPPKQFQAIKPTESKAMKLRRIIKEEYKTGREHLAHEAIDTEIGRDNLLTMSQMPERQLVGGVGTGLDALAGFSKAASLITSGTPKFIKMLKDLKVSTVFDPDTKRAVMSHAKKIRDTNPSEYAKYKDAPSRELMDIVLKLDDLAIKSPKTRAVEDAKYLLDENLLRAMKEIKRTGMEGTIVQGTESNIKNTYRTLMELMRGTKIHDKVRRYGVDKHGRVRHN